MNRRSFIGRMAAVMGIGGLSYAVPFPVSGERYYLICPRMGMYIFRSDLPSHVIESGHDHGDALRKVLEMDVWGAGHRGRRIDRVHLMRLSDHKYHTWYMDDGTEVPFGQVYYVAENSTTDPVPPVYLGVI